MNELYDGFITQCQIDAVQFDHTAIESLYNALHSDNQRRRAQLKDNVIEQRIAIIQHDYKQNEISQAKETTYQLRNLADQLQRSIDQMREQFHELKINISLQKAYTSDIPKKAREIQQLSILKLIDYQHYRSEHVTSQEKLLQSQSLKQKTLNSIKNSTEQLAYEYQTDALRIKRLEARIAEQKDEIHQLDEQHENIQDKLRQQSDIVLQLKALIDLEHRFLLNDQLEQESVSLYQMIVDYNKTHRISVSDLSKQLLITYETECMRLDSAVHQAELLMNEKQNLEPVYIPQVEEDANEYENTQSLHTAHTIKESQNSWKRQLIMRAECFILKIHNSLLTCIYRFNGIASKIKSDKFTDLRTFCQNTNNNTITLSQYQILQLIPESKSKIIIYNQIQSSQLIKLYLTEELLNRDFDFLQQFNNACLHYRLKIQEMISLMQMITQLTKVRTVRDLKEPNRRKHVTEQTTESRIRTVKKFSFSSQMGSMRIIETDIETERYRIKNPLSTRSQHAHPLSRQQLYCMQLQGSDKGIHRREIINNFKSLINLRKNRK